MASVTMQNKKVDISSLIRKSVAAAAANATRVIPRRQFHVNAATCSIAAPTAAGYS